MDEEVSVRFTDPVCLAVELDQQRIADLLDGGFDPEAAAIRQRGLNRLPTDPPAQGGEVQELLRPWIDEALQAIQLEAQRMELLRWLVLARAGIGLLWNAITRMNRFTWADHTNILRMFFLAAFQYGQRQDYFSRYGFAVEVTADNPNVSFPRLSNTELRSVRRLLHLCTVLFEAEKAFRTAPRGVGFSRDGALGLVAHYENCAVAAVPRASFARRPGGRSPLLPLSSVPGVPPTRRGVDSPVGHPPAAAGGARPAHGRPAGLDRTGARPGVCQP